MGELSRYEANKYRNDYVALLTSVMNKINENFEEMDFQNADKWNDMERRVRAANTYIKMEISELNGIYFE